MLLVGILVLGGIVWLLTVIGLVSVVFTLTAKVTDENA